MEPVAPPGRRTLRPLGGGGDEEVLEPAQVGARMIQPAESGRSTLVPRLLAIGALLLLVAAVVAIALGVGLV